MKTHLKKHTVIEHKPFLTTVTADIDFNYSPKIYELPEVVKCNLAEKLTESYRGKSGRSKEAGGLISVLESTCDKAGAGGEGLLRHRKKHPEPGQLYHQQGLLSDCHLGLLHQAYTER